MSGHDYQMPVSCDYATIGHFNTTCQSQMLPRKSSDGEEFNDGSSSPRKRLTRVVGKSVDNITKSFSGRSTAQQTAGSPPGHRRIFSLNRKGKGKDMSYAGGHSDSESLDFSVNFVVIAEFISVFQVIVLLRRFRGARRATCHAQQVLSNLFLLSRQALAQGMTRHS